MQETDSFTRPLPVVDDGNAHFWRGGADGVLRFSRCNACAALLHPPPPVCRYCRSQDIGVAGVSGRGVVVGVTVNHQLWDPRFPPPFVIATVAIEEDPRVRLLTNLVGVAAGEAHVGMLVRVRFEPAGDVWLPLFEPDGGDIGELPSDETPPGDHRRWVRPMRGADKFEDRVAITGVGTQLTERVAWEQSTMTHEPQVLGPAAHLWLRTSLRPSDVQVAELYDGFTFNCVSWLEALGFCGIGEARDFLDGGKAIARDGGVVALNTHGGQLSAGRTHGMGLLHEAVVQLRGEGGARQVAGARVAVVSSGGLTPAGAILLRHDS